MCQLWTESELYAVESAFEPLDDLISVGMIGELLDWARMDPVLMRLADPSRTYLCGHSRVGLPASFASSFQDISPGRVCGFDHNRNNKSLYIDLLCKSICATAATSQ